MDIDDILIQEVKNHSILYDYSHSEYRNLKKKECEWREIAATTKLNVNECKKRWKGLRDSYKRCKKKDFKSGDKTRRKWRYFSALQFLDKITGSRRNPRFDWTMNSPDPLSQSSQALSLSSWEREDIKDTSSQISQAPTTFSLQEKKRKFTNDFEDFIDLAESNISEDYKTEVSQTHTQDSSPLKQESTEAQGTTLALSSTRALATTQALDTTQTLAKTQALDTTQTLDTTQALGATQALDSTHSLDSKQVQYSTATYFAILAEKIRIANMPSHVINRIEAQVSAVVFKEMESFYSTVNKKI